MLRTTLAILAVLIIPACDWRDSWDSDHEVSISNQGTTSVWVEIRYGEDGWGNEWRRDFSLEAGERRVDSYPWDQRVDVRIYNSEGTLIFSDVFSPADFEDHDDRISIIVNP